jgi:hypothetical protein
MMKALRNDRGGITLAVLAPVVAALIGGSAAVLAAVQITNMAPTGSDSAPVVNQVPGEVQYGDR